MNLKYQKFITTTTLTEFASEQERIMTMGPEGRKSELLELRRLMLRYLSGSPHYAQYIKESQLPWIDAELSFIKEESEPEPMENKVFRDWTEMARAFNAEKQRVINHAKEKALSKNDYNRYFTKQQGEHQREYRMPYEIFRKVYRSIHGVDPKE